MSDDNSGSNRGGSRTGMPSPRHRPTRRRAAPIPTPDPDPAPLPNPAPPAFEITEARFITSTNRVEVDITRHLPLSEQVDSINLDFILRATDDPVPSGERTPGYYGDTFMRRTQNPVPVRLDQARFCMSSRTLHLRSDAMSAGPTSPATHVPHPFEIRYAVDSQPFHLIQLVGLIEVKTGSCKDGECKEGPN